MVLLLRAAAAAAGASGPGATVRSTLTEPFMRRVAKLSEDDELFAQQEY
jgi:hypothetical protein